MKIYKQLRKIYEEVDGNEYDKRFSCYIVKAKAVNQKQYSHVATISSTNGKISYLNETAKVDFLVSEMLSMIKKDLYYESTRKTT